MKRYGLVAAVVLLALIGLMVFRGRPTDAPVQSDYRPKGLDIVDTVKERGTDRKSRRFLRDGLPEAVQKASASFTAAVIARDFAQLALDPARLEIAERTRVRVYFVGENSGYNNALGVNTQGVGIDEGNPRLVFPHPYTSADLYESAGFIDPETELLDETKLGERSQENPLLPGDFVDLGSLSAGTTLSFFLISDNRQGDVNVFTPIPERNPDGIMHMVAIVMEDSPYPILSFEDMYNGGDRDYSDCVFAVEMSGYNVQALLGRIDPWRQVKRMALLSTLLAVFVGGPLGFLAWRRWVHRKQFIHARDLGQQFLKAADFGAALKVTKEAKNSLQESHYRKALTELEITVLENFGDVGGLCRVYDETANAFETRENPSLTVGRAMVETEHFEEFADLRNRWRDHEADPSRWLALEADVLIKQDKPSDAAAVFDEMSSKREPGPACLARLALACVRNDPDKARSLVARAIERAPDDADVRLHQGTVAEALGSVEEAKAGYGAALSLAPKDPFIRDHAAEFFRRNGAYAEALKTWAAGLAPPTLDHIWSKTLFWTRVAGPINVDWDNLEMPPGELRPLVKFLRRPEPGRFWNDDAFEPIGQAHPVLVWRQECFWLRVLESLRTHHEAQALSLLALSSFGERSWHADMELALLRILQFQRLGFVVPNLAQLQSSPSARRHPFFKTLDDWVRGEDNDSRESMQRLVIGDEAFAAACLAAGWAEAGLRLRRNTPIPSGLPDWFTQDVLAAIRRIRGEAAAQTFAREHGLSRG